VDEPCVGEPVDLNVLAPEERRRVLVAKTALFANLFQRWVEAHRTEGLSYPRLALLEALHCQGPAIMRSLADQLGVTPRTMTAAVDALEGGGLVVVGCTRPTDGPSSSS
jgi:DNA-binding transcriptional ArsR family regulator